MQMEAPGRLFGKAGSLLVGISLALNSKIKTPQITPDLGLIYGVIAG
jgi:hypothetical protein